VVDAVGQPVAPHQEGNLVIKPDFSSVMSAIWNNPSKHGSYFTNNWYVSGDRAKKDEDGYIWFIGRADDIINTSGERVGPFEVESALIAHPAVVEAGVIGKPHETYGESIKAFVVLQEGITASDELIRELIQFVKDTLSHHSAPREIAFVNSLPKTRSGKIMRRILKAREMGLPEGDMSTLEEM
jgi:acetyl-CoA synthetase